MPLLNPGKSDGLFIDFPVLPPFARILSAIVEITRSTNMPRFHVTRYVGEAEAVCDYIAKRILRTLDITWASAFLFRAIA